jgi:hypothetical protein
MDCTGISIDQAVIFPIPIFPNLANTSLPLGYVATVGAKLTLNFSSLQ